MLTKAISLGAIFCAKGRLCAAFLSSRPAAGITMPFKLNPRQILCRY